MNEEQTPVEEQAVEEEVVETPAVEETTESEEVAAPEPVKKSNKRSRERRIQQLVAQREAEKEKRIELEAKLAEKSSVATKAPSRDQFDDEDDYLDARMDWRADKKLDKQRVHQEQQSFDEQQHKANAEIKRRFDTMTDKGVDEFDDYENVVLNSPVNVTDNIAQSLIEMNAGHLVSYYLGSNPDKTAEICQKSNYRQTVALRRIEKELTNKKTTNALPPALGKKGVSAGISVDPSKMSPNEYRQMRHKQWQKKGQRI